MRRGLLFTFVAVAIGCATHQQNPPPDRLHPIFEEFTANIHYPYHATTARQQQIKRGAYLLRKGMTETAVLQLMGAPDYKVRWFDPFTTLRGEVWQYVHTWDRPITADYHGRMVTITLEEADRTATLLDFDASAFGVRRHEDHQQVAIGGGALSPVDASQIIRVVKPHCQRGDSIYGIRVKSPTEVEVETGHLTAPGFGGGEIFRVRKIGGKWKVDLSTGGAWTT